MIERIVRLASSIYYYFFFIEVRDSERDIAQNIYKNEYTLFSVFEICYEIENNFYQKKNKK